MLKKLLPAGAALLAAITSNATAEAVMGGRPVDPKKDFAITFRVGEVTDIEGSVEETTRRVYELEGTPEKQFDAESYDLNELGLSSSDTTYGIGLEKQWRYVTLRGDLAYLSAEATGVAKRDYFIGVDDVDYNGRSYENMKIEQGEAYKATLDGAMAALRAQITPFTIAPENIVSFTPWIHLGLQVVAANFAVDAGPAEGLQSYENPPRTYVIGGSGEGNGGVFTPEIGIGGELRIFLWENQAGLVELNLQGTYAIFNYNGSSDTLGISARNDKDLDVDYDAFELRGILNYPLSDEVDLLFGAEFKMLTADASSKAKITSDEEALAKRERFDKDINLELTAVEFFAGVRF